MIKKKLIILFFCFKVQGQELHHQMLCIQGTYALLPNKMIVHQTIGQQSISGNYRKSDLVINHGYQQGTYLAQYSIYIPKDLITTKTYPNPASEVLNFEFSSAIRGVIKVIIFDLLGKVVFYQEKMAIGNMLTIDNIYLPEGKYLVKLTSENYNYSTKILILK